MMQLAWRQAPAPLALAWRGPDLTLMAAAQRGEAETIAALIGPPGPAGSAASGIVQIVAGAALGGQRAVSLNGTGEVVYFSDLAATVIGVTTGAVLMGQIATVRISDVLEEPTWAWTPGLPVFASAGGVLTQVPPATGVLVLVGTALSPTTMRIDPEPPTTLI